MRSFAARTALLVAVQAVCAAVGIWMHQRLLLSTSGEGGSGRLDQLLCGVIAAAWTTVLLAVAGWVFLRRIRDEQERQHQGSVGDLVQQSRQLVRARDAVIFGLAKLADSRDEQTGEHLDRISAYAATLASAARRHPRFADQVSPAFIALIQTSAVLHDIGKVGIEDAILRKPGPLTEEERTRMQAHTRIGAACLEEIERRLGSSNFLRMAREIALCHHEHWDASGYPRGLAGTEIPLSARIVAIADVYDALASQRPYKPATPHEQCVELVRAGRGTQFDPELVDVWMSVAHRFGEIAAHFTPPGGPDFEGAACGTAAGPGAARGRAGAAGPAAPPVEEFAAIT